MNIASIYSLTPIARPWPSLRGAYTDLYIAHEKLMQLLAMWEDIPSDDALNPIWRHNLFTIYDTLAFAIQQLSSPVNKKRGGGRVLVTQADLKRAALINQTVREINDLVFNLWTSYAQRNKDTATVLFQVEATLALVIGKGIRASFVSETSPAKDLLEDGEPWSVLLKKMGREATPRRIVDGLKTAQAAVA